MNEDKIMNNDENANKSTTSNKTKIVADVMSNIMATLLKLKKSNPKAFFGASGAFVLVILILMISDGDAPKQGMTDLKMGNIVVGQFYELRAVNSYDPQSTVRLVSTPGSLAAYDDTESADRIGGCKHMPQGTKIKVTQLQRAFEITKFAEVEMVSGECAGQKGWTLIANLK